MLMEQVTLQDAEIDAMKKEIEHRDEQLVVMGKNFNQATQALQELRNACDALGEEKMRCERHVQELAASLAQLEAQKESVQHQANAAQQQRTALEVLSCRVSLFHGRFLLLLAVLSSFLL